MLYTAKCYWPGVTEDELRLTATRAQNEAGERRTAFKGALYLPADELVLCLFEAPSSTEVKRVSQQLRIPCERVMEAAWLPPPDRDRSTGRSREENQ